MNAGDHPRSRGEYAFLEIPDKGHFGSSPLSRGIHIYPVRKATGIRIIPALAGNTFGVGLGRGG